MALTTKTALEKFPMKDSEASAFLARFGMHPVELSSNTTLYKYSGDYPFRQDLNRWSPWWNARSGARHVLPDGKEVSWTGLAPRLTAAMKGNFSDVKAARVRSAVKHEWNSMRNLFIVRLNVQAWAWFGQCKGQRASDTDPNYANLHLMGGDFQYYIPELERHEITVTSAHCGSDDGTS